MQWDEGEGGGGKIRVVGELGEREGVGVWMEEGMKEGKRERWWYGKGGRGRRRGE